MHSNRVNDTSPPTGGRSNYLRCGVTRRRACRRRRIICGLRDRQLDKSARARCASARAKRWPDSASAGGEGRRRCQARRIAQTRSPASCPRPRPSSCDETNAIGGTRPEEFGSSVPRRTRSEVQGLGRVRVCPMLLLRVSTQDTCGPLQLRNCHQQRGPREPLRTDRARAALARISPFRGQSLQRSHIAVTGRGLFGQLSRVPLERDCA